MDFATLLELVGLALVVIAAWMISPVTGMVALGVAFVLVGYLMERD